MDENFKYDFLCCAYIGITPENAQNDNAIKKCCDRAYLDLCRTIHFKEEYKENFNYKLEFKNSVCEIIKSTIKLIEKFDFINSEFEDFKNCWHYEACNKIIESAEKFTDDFHYGQAQKWLNMALKYLTVLGCCNEVNQHFEDLQIPVDSYIMEAASEKFSIKLPIENSENKHTYYYNSKSWSKWDAEEYFNFQKNVMGKIDKEPLIWETYAWIEVAKKRAENDNK